MFVVHCGAGSQKIRWLADVAIHRFDPYFAMDTGLAAEARFENQDTRKTYKDDGDNSGELGGGV